MPAGAGKPYWNPAKGDQVLYKGTFVANGSTPVTISNLTLNRDQVVVFSLNTVGGTVGAHPQIQTITPQVTGGDGSITVSCTAGDTSTYNYMIL